MPMPFVSFTRIEVMTHPNVTPLNKDDLIKLATPLSIVVLALSTLVSSALLGEVIARKAITIDGELSVSGSQNINGELGITGGLNAYSY